MHAAVLRRDGVDSTHLRLGAALVLFHDVRLVVGRRLVAGRLAAGTRATDGAVNPTAAAVSAAAARSQPRRRSGQRSERRNAVLLLKLGCHGLVVVGHGVFYHVVLVGEIVLVHPWRDRNGLWEAATEKNKFRGIKVKPPPINCKQAKARS